MALFILNESRDSGVAGDLTAYTDLKSLFAHVERTDVKNAEYWLFDSEGHFYEFEIDEASGDMRVMQKYFDLQKAERVVGEFLRIAGIEFRRTAPLREKAQLIGRYY